MTVPECELFLLAGGRLTLADWAGLSDETKASMATAGHRLRMRWAAAGGRAAHDMVGHNEVLSEVDGGQEHNRALLAAAVEVACRRAT